MFGLSKKSTAVITNLTVKARTKQLALYEKWTMFSFYCLWFHSTKNGSWIINTCKIIEFDNKYLIYETNKKKKQEKNMLKSDVCLKLDTYDIKQYTHTWCVYGEKKRKMKKKN